MRLICILIDWKLYCCSLTHDPKLLPQEEATYAEPILMPTSLSSKPLNLSTNNGVIGIGGSVGMSTLGGGGAGASSTTSPKATLRKIANLNNTTLFGPPESDDNPPPLPPQSNCPVATSMYAYGVDVAFGAPLPGSGGVMQRGADPYSSFRSRAADPSPYASTCGTLRGGGGGHAYNPPPPIPQGIAPSGSDAFGTLRGSKAANLGDGYGTTRSVKKVYL